MDIDHRPQRAPTAGAAATNTAAMPGKRILTESLVVQSGKPVSAPDAQFAESGTAASTPAPLPVSASSGPRPTLQMLFGVQRAATPAPVEDPAQVHAAAAARGTATPDSKLPYADQRVVGWHDISGIQAHVPGGGGASSPTPGPGHGLGAAPAPSAASGASVQRKQLPSRDEEPATPALAGVADGIAGAGSPLPHLETIQRAFGPAHDLASVRAHVGSSAASSATRISAEAYTVGNHVAFRTAPDLRLAAHEAAHVVQQRSGAVAPGLGQAGDAHERAADDVAERVARGEAIEHLLPAAGSETAARAVQRRKLDNGDVVPDDLQVTWAGDPFTIRFDHRAGSPDGRFVFTLHYTGPHPVDGPFIDKIAKVVSISAGPIGAQTLAATMVRQVGTTLTVDLYGDNTTLVKLIDKPGFDPQAALNSGRRHTLGIEVNGTPRADSAGIWIKDPAASPIAASTIQDDALMSGGYLISSGGYANPSDADMNALSNASATVGLAKQAGGASGAPATLEGDIDAFENRLGEVRQTAMQKGLIQKVTFEAWLRLSTAFIKLSPQIRANAIKPEAQNEGADAAAALYQALKAETDPTEKMKMGSTTWNAYTGEMATRKSGQGMGPDAWSVRGFGPEFADDVRAGRWVKVNDDYHKLVGGFDRWVVKRLKDTGNAQFAAQAEAFGQMRGQLHTLDGKQARRLYAVFHSEEQLETDGRLTEVPLSLYYWREGDTWHLKDLTNPANPFDDTLAVGKPDETEPSEALFAKLDAKIHFPKGIIHYQIPGGRGGQIKTTAPTSWHEYLAYIGMGAALVGTTLVTFGTGTVVVAGTWILAGSGVISAVAAGGDLAEHYEHGNLDATTAVIDIAQIVAGLAGTAALAQGAIALDAANAAKAGTPWAGKWAQLAVFGEKTRYIPLGTKVAADVVTVVAMADKAAEQLDQIESSGGSRADRDRAKAQLLAQFALSGGLVALSIKGDLGTLGKGRTLRLHQPENGPPVALLSGMEAPTGLKFSQKDVGPKTGDGKLTIEQLTENMKNGGWNGDPIHVVELADGSKVSLDNRRLLAAQNAGLKEIPVLYHNPAEKIDPKYAEEAFRLAFNIRKLEDGSLVVGGTKGTIAYPKDSVATTYGEAALFRTANQGNLKGTKTRFPLYGNYEQPVVRRPKVGSGPPPEPE